MARTTPPLFGSDWTAGQIERFEETKSEVVSVSYAYEFVEAALAFLTFKIFHVMIPGEPPHARSALRHIQETAIEIVCRRLLGEQQPPSGPPLLHRREDAPPEDMMPDRKLLMDTVKYWSASCPFPTFH